MEGMSMRSPRRSDTNNIDILGDTSAINIPKLDKEGTGQTGGHGDEDDFDSNPHMSFRQVEAVNVSVRNLSISVSQKPNVSRFWTRKKKGESDVEEGQRETKIIDDISMDIPSGHLIAIMGGSGSGKTSLLNTMAHRIRGGNMHLSGTTTYNGSHTLSNVRHAYVMQHDVLLPRLTVRETLRYSARLRLPSKKHINELVEEVILQLGLKECANTIIGDNIHKGCSGGEKRRVSIGVQLLSNPSVLFLDEPTTGLDATSAFQLVRTLKNLARKGRTIVITLHQPRSEIWGLFDRITLLARGCAVYSGEVDKVAPYFEDLGYPLPRLVNPADYLIDIAAIDYRTPEAEEASVNRLNSLIAAWRDYESRVLSRVYTEYNITPPGNTLTTTATGASDFEEVTANWASAKPPLWRQLSVLTSRTFYTTIRDPFGLSGCAAEAVLMGVIIGWIFYNLGGSLSAIRSREGALYMAAAQQGYLILLFETYRLCEIDVKVFDREHGEGVVGVLAFLISRRLAKLLVEDIPVPLLFSTIYYFMCGFDKDARQFFVFFSVVLLNHYLSITFATLAVGVSRNFAEASLFGNLSYTLQSMACGFFVQASTIPVYLRWTKYVAYNWYAVGALVSNEFTDSFYDCPLEGGRSNPGCLQYDGNFVLESLDFPRNWITEPICICLAWVIAFYAMAGLLLYFFKVDINMTSTKANDDKDKSAGKEKLSSLQAEDGPQTRKIDVLLDDFKLTVHIRSFFGRGGMDLEILKGVSSRFEAGKLNVIMGPSGSGKSSLLNLMARRLRNSFTTRYRSGGRILLNGAVPSDVVIRSLCSYVTQDDDALLPFLTVRETLHFAAALRLPSHMPSADKERRAEEVILKMGLKDCADVVIGSEFTKGISGGQKRRVTIAVQVLTEPRILLLDEPTSGLDAFTAASILTVLHGLAGEGRTVICTIHQSRSELFEKFGNVLLLARGGHTMYSGAASGMLPYFSSLGHECPSKTNPADFALDLITVDLQHTDREKESRSKIQDLISAFSHSDALALPASDQQRTVSLPAELGAMKRQMSPFWRAYPVLLRRSLLNIKRQPPIIAARIMQVMGLGIVLGLFFAPLGHDYVAVQNHLGYIQQFTALLFVGMLQNLVIYPTERDVFYKEHEDGAYSPTSFFCTYTAHEVPFEVLASLLFALIGDLAVGLPRTPQLFFVIAANVFFIVNCGESIGIVFNTFFSHKGFAVNITSTVIALAVAMSGIISTQMPLVLDRINCISPLRYAIRNMVPYSLRGVVFTCTDRERLPNGQCPITTGDQAMELYGLEGAEAWSNLVGLAVAALVYRIIAYVVLVGKRGRLFGCLGE